MILSDKPWLTDGGLETSLIFHDNVDLPLFASFHALEDEDGRWAAMRYFERFIELAKMRRTGFVLDTCSWRIGAHWGRELGRDAEEMSQVARQTVAFAKQLRDKHETETTPIIVNGVIGPSGDGYAPETMLTANEAESLHEGQIADMLAAGVDMVTAVTMTHTGEAIGIVRAATKAGLPVMIAFTTETDGHLPSGTSLEEAIRETDAATDAAPIWYMVNCAHPDHFSAELEAGDWRARIGGVRANASRMSHAELDEAEELDDGDPVEFGMLYGALSKQLPNLRVVGGCCGTDHRHVDCAANVLIDSEFAA